MQRNRTTGFVTLSPTEFKVLEELVGDWEEDCEGKDGVETTEAKDRFILDMGEIVALDALLKFPST